MSDGKVRIFVVTMLLITLILVTPKEAQAQAFQPPIVNNYNAECKVIDNKVLSFSVNITISDRKVRVNPSGIEVPLSELSSIFLENNMSYLEELFIDALRDELSLYGANVSNFKMSFENDTKTVSISFDLVNLIKNTTINVLAKDPPGNAYVFTMRWRAVVVEEQLFGKMNVDGEVYEVNWNTSSVLDLTVFSFPLEVWNRSWNVLESKIYVFGALISIRLVLPENARYINVVEDVITYYIPKPLEFDYSPYFGYSGFSLLLLGLALHFVTKGRVSRVREKRR
ncbi:MAG: hypothetical protein ACTSYT_00040 [Candidatus Asgardarchaeia archaeon]